MFLTFLIQNHKSRSSWLRQRMVLRTSGCVESDELPQFNHTASSAELKVPHLPFQKHQDILFEFNKDSSHLYHQKLLTRFQQFVVCLGFGIRPDLGASCFKELLPIL
jgi:hypothetical protein